MVIIMLEIIMNTDSDENNRRVDRDGERRPDRLPVLEQQPRVQPQPLATEPQPVCETKNFSYKVTTDVDYCEFFPLSGIFFVFV